MKTLSADGKVMTEEATRKHLQRCSDHWDQHGFGLWVFRDKTDGQFIGRGGLMTYQIDGKDVVGLAYAVMSDHWNLGFATEMAEASLAVWFVSLGWAKSAHGRCRSTSPLSVSWRNWGSVMKRTSSSPVWHINPTGS